MPKRFATCVVLSLWVIACNTGGPTGNGNRAPTANAGSDQSVAAGATVNLSGSGSDPDGDPLSFSWAFVSRPGGSGAAIANAGAANGSFVADVAGTYEVRLTVSDGRGGTATDTVRIVAGSGSNRAPTANAGSDQSVAVGATANLSGSGSDPDGDPLSFSWAFVSRPGGSGAAIANATAANTSFVADVAGTYDVRLTVSDGRGGTATDDVRIVAGVANRAPIANAGPDVSVTVGGSVTLNGSASSDPDGDVLTFSWSFLSRPAGSSAAIVDAGSPVASFVPDVLGTYQVRLTVSDGQLAATDTALVTAAQANRAPSLAVSGPSAVYVGTEIEVVASASDPDGDALTITFELVEKPAGSSAGLSVFGNRARFTGDVIGGYLVRVTASDGKAAVQADHRVFANPHVDGSYAVHLVADPRSCGRPVDERDGILPVLQPSAGRVILDLPSASSSFKSQAAGTLEGETFSFSGPIMVDVGPPTGVITINGVINGTIGANGAMDLGFSFSLGFCNIIGTIRGNRLP